MISKIKIAKLSPKAVFVLLSFLLWVFCFRGFISGRLMLQGDAGSYYEHFKFYIDNIATGVYPMWEPTRADGVPTDFFMQRIGSFNPVFLLILVLSRIGISYLHSYLIFLAVYYFIGLWGFYLLSEEIFMDKKYSFAAFLLLMFSSMGARLFESYVVLTFVPLVWFFFFFVKFFKNPQKVFWAGLTFSLMILFVTYIPFYFLVIFMVFLLCFVALYFNETKQCILKLFHFVKSNKFLAAFCVFALILSIIPGALIYQGLGRGETVMPSRHSQSAHDNELVIDKQRVDEGGLQPVIVTTGMFSNLKYLKLSTFYIPVFCFIPFILGSITRISRRQIFFVLFGGAIYLISIADASPVAPFLYKHFFIFKLFRNYEHFLWFAILLVVILFSIDLLKSFLKFSPKNRIEKISLYLFIILAHTCFIVFLFHQEGTLVSAYLVVALSLIFHIIYFSTCLKENVIFIFAALFFMVVLQPVEVYSYLNKNALKAPVYHSKGKDPYRYLGGKPFLRLRLENRSPFLNKSSSDVENDNDIIEGIKNNLNPPTVYMTFAMKWFYYLRNNINYDAYCRYARNKLILFDNVELVDDKDLDLKKVSSNLGLLKNLAFISYPYNFYEDKNDDNFIREQANIKNTVFFDKGVNEVPTHAEVVTADSNIVKIIMFNVNQLKLQTKLTRRRFLVYNDCFHSGWKAFIDGREQMIWRANMAYKGLWVPAGEHVILMRFESPVRHMFNYFILFFYVFFFVYLIYLFCGFSRLKN